MLHSKPLHLRCAMLLCATLFAAAASAQTVRLQTRQVVSGLTRPLLAISPPGDHGRLFIVEQSGLVKILENGAVLPTPFLDIEALVGGTSAGEERGLLGMAFHPDYATNRRFYVSYTDTASSSNVREYRADASNPDQADVSSFTTILPAVPHGIYHNGGCLEFAPDGMLYLSLGDGTQGPDSQSLASYLGKILRFDVDNPPRFVAAGNPFPGSGFPLIWSYGWRNPWRFTFDRLTGDLYAGDVGSGAWEEIDFQSASSAGGENYGWRCMEGNHCTGMTDCVCNASSLTRPIYEYPHPTGCATIGGYVYDGNEIPAFRGNYIFADFCNGRVWSLTFDGATVSNFVDRTAELDPPGPATLAGITSFGRDGDGELYICLVNGVVYRIEAACLDPVSYCTATPNSASSGALMGSAGSTSLAANDLVLKCSGCPAHVNGLFIYGHGRTQTPLGNGYRCIPGPLRRLPIVQTDATGAVSQPFDASGSPAGITPGSVWSFQYWFRDVAGGGALFDLSDGLEVTFCN